MGNIRPAQIAEKYEAPDIPNEERRALCTRLTEQGLSPQWSETVAWADMLPPLGMFRRLALIGRMIQAEFSAEQIHEAIQHTGWPGDIEDTLAMVRAARPFAEHPALLGYQERYFVLKDFGGKCRVCWFDDDGRFRHQSPAEFKLAEANEKIQVGTTKDGVPVMASAAKVWFEHRHRRQYDRARFAPGEPQTLDGGNTINLWRGWPVPLVETKEQATGFMGHIFRHVCGGDNHAWNWLLSWLADAVQNVHRTAGTAIVLRGAQGSGKNFFVERIMELFAPHAITLTRSEQMTGNFNAHLMDKTMVFANEAFFAGSNKDKNALKALVTDGTMLV